MLVEFKQLPDMYILNNRIKNGEMMNLPNFLLNDFNEMKLTTNQFQKFHKLVHFNLKLLKYIAILLYTDSKYSAFKNIKADKLLVSKFQTPTEGQWITLLEQLLSSKENFYSKKYSLLKKRLSAENIQDFNIAYASLIRNDKFHDDNLSCFDFFARIISIKNKQISHGIISEDKALEINKRMEPLTISIIEKLSVIFETPLIMFHEDESGEDCYTNIHNASKIVETSLELQNGINVIFNNKGYSLYPFLLSRDGNIYFYNSFDIKNNKIHYQGAVGKDTYKKTAANDVFELFEVDKELLFIKTLENKVKISKKGVSHNLPVKEYKDFIGRKDEFILLEKMIAHKRHFMSALDGIGGVGKTALAYHLCDEITENEKYFNMKFEYIIWLSAKTTKLVNGKIYNIDKAFEHLDQLLDSILDVLSFPEYKNLETTRKREIVFELLELANCLIVLDNLETISGENLNDIWLFICDIPTPSKVLFTSREYSFDVAQILRIEKLSYLDSVAFIKNIRENLKEITLLNESEKRIIELSSGLPIALTSILGQVFAGKSLRSIENGIKNNTDDLSKFCFQEQLKKLKEDHLKVIILNALSIQELSLDSITFILGNYISDEADKILNEIRSLSIVKMNRNNDETTYSMLPLIKDYVLSSRKAKELLEPIQKKINDFLLLNDTESYSLPPIEERTINKGSLMPRKIVDKAMKHAENEELEEAESIFKNCIKQYPKESYVWYMFSLFQAQFISQHEESISSLKQAINIEENYIYYKKIADLHIKLKNYDASIKYYKLAKIKSEVGKNKDEMSYLIGNAYFQKVKQIRRELKRNRNEELYNTRNECYINIISLFEKYLETQPTIYDGKKIRIYRLLAESHFGISNYNEALKYIDVTIDLSEYDDGHVDYRHFILERMERKTPIRR